MKILGISDGMTGGVALLEAGQIRYAIHEERLIRAKMATGFPQASIAQVLADTGTSPAEIGAIAIPTVNEIFRAEAIAYDGWLLREQEPLKELLLNVSSGVNQVFGASPRLRRYYYQLKSALGRARRRIMVERLRQDWGFTCPIQFIDHHFAHACCAYFTSGLPTATVITMDGAGDHTSSRVYFVDAGQFHLRSSVDSFNSLGNYYAYITHLCGFKAQRHEGKITGLAARGKPLYADLLRQFITYCDGTIVNQGQVFYWAAVKAIAQALPTHYQFEDLAASIQQVLEAVGGAYIHHWVQQTGCGDLALAGGVFANVRFNQTIHELPSVQSIFVHPGMGDEGLALGAAFAMQMKFAAQDVAFVAPQTLTDVYWGPSYGERDIEAAIAQSSFRADRMPDIEAKVAQLLAQGAVVARFNGPMEYGPRALGNRSILYQPTDPSVNSWLNQRLNRTEFMPFAPVTLAEFGDQCYANLEGARDSAQFMTITFDCTDWMWRHCPAVVHVDGTARPQLIASQSNPSYYRIIEQYHQLTGIPCVINTSFNLHEEPIVCSPSDAIRAFEQGNLDYLAMGSYLLTHPRRMH